MNDKSTVENKIIQRNAKVEQKKQKILKQLHDKKERKQYILNTKVAIKKEQLAIKASLKNIQELDNSNEVNEDKVMYIQSDLDEQLLKVDNTKICLEKEVEQIQNIERKVKEIEKTTKDNEELQSIIEQKQNEIVNTVNELKYLNDSTCIDYDLFLKKREEMQFKIKELTTLTIANNNPVNDFAIKSKWKETARMKKYDEKKKQLMEKHQRLNDIKQAKIALKQEQLKSKQQKKKSLLSNSAQVIKRNEEEQQTREFYEQYQSELKLALLKKNV